MTVPSHAQKAYRQALAAALQSIDQRRLEVWRGQAGPAAKATMAPVLSAPPPPSPLILAWVQGVVSTVYATFDALQGRTDGKVFHRYQVGSDEELAWSTACQWTSQRLMEGAMRREELRKD